MKIGTPRLGRKFDAPQSHSSIHRTVFIGRHGVRLPQFGFSAPAFAYTECNETVAKIWAGDGGMIWIYYNDGGAAIITSSDPNREAAISLATTALVTGRHIVVRYNASVVSCTTAGVNDFAGLFLLK